MRLVIDIPEDVKSRLANGITYRQDLQIISEALANGTVLPKGHGDLIDRNSITCENTWKEWSPDHNYYVVCIAPALVEGDKEKADER